MKKSFILFLFSTSLVFGAQIKSIKFSGLHYMSDKTATDISGLKVGGDLNSESSNRAITNIYEQGYFKNILIKEDNGNVVIFVEEKPTVAKYDIEGIVTNDQKTIADISDIKPGQMYDAYKINSTEDRIKGFYELKGFFDTVVNTEIAPINENKQSLQVTTKVNRGENLIIKKVNLEGNTILSYGNIEPKIMNKQREIFGWMWGFNDGKVKLNELYNDSLRIKDEYYKKGYIDANVSNPLLLANMDNYTAELTYYIQEGPKYHVNNIKIDAPGFLNLDDKKIINDLKLQHKDVMNVIWMRKDIKKLEDMVSDLGYAYVNVNPKIEKQENNTIDITYVIKPNEKVYIRNLTISGNRDTKDKIIRREVYLTEGDLYNRTDLVESKNGLKRTGYFDDVNINENKVGADKVDLDVDVKETKTGTISGGIGYGSSDGFLINASVSDRNVFGTGLKGEISVDKSDKTLGGRISLTNPRMFDSEYSLGGSIYANKYDWNDYDEREKGLSLTVGRKLGRNLNSSVTYVLEKTQIKGLDEFYTYAGYLNGRRTKSSIIPSLIYDNTDDFFLPRNGMIANTSLEYAGLGGDIKFAKANGSFKYFKGLEDYIDWDVIFRYSANVGYIWQTGNSNDLPINEKLFMGGMGSVRGFERRSVPKREYCIPGRGCKYIESGGSKSFDTSLELSFPLIDRIKMRLITFVDYGMIGDKGQSWAKEQRYSTGFGIEWQTPIAPLQFYFMKPLNPKKHDDTSRFEFMMGRSF